MAMNANTWGTAVAQAVAAVNVQAGTPITPEQLVLVWQAICGAHRTHLISNMVTTTPGATAGPTALPGTVS